MILALAAEPLYSHNIILTRGGGGGGHASSGGHSSSSSHSFSSSRSSSSSSKSYSSTRSTTPKSSTKGSTSKPSYKSTRNSTPITKSNLYSRTTVQQRTTVVNNYSTAYVGYHSFFHPFGWGMYGGDFWFWMYIFDHNQYVQNQQIVQAQNVTVAPQNQVLQDIVFVVLALAVGAGLVWLVLLIIAHLRWL